MDDWEYETPEDMREPGSSYMTFSEHCPNCGRQWHGLPKTDTFPNCPGAFDQAMIIKGRD